ncbi:nuclear transcription factor Y subunit A-3-like isoform X2 [Carya illinoinensis]|uniref:nuclear transcription factor Y subunit A-3-like isoform X2 n=1 Tax=Carya illinoinensis TaxID=32201 RepID=UPI001C726034|nr:nuclear transcription factor Y subunit A-3-like isoform X2 [Carya illinoinensis]
MHSSKLTTTASAAIISCFPALYQTQKVSLFFCGILSMKMGVPQHFHNTKQLNFQFQDQDSSSTQSTGESYPEVVSMGESNPCVQGIVSPQSGFIETKGKPIGGIIKSVSPIGTQDFVFSPSQLDYSQSIARIPFPYADPYFGGLLAAAYGPESIIHPSQMIGVAPPRVPLPLDLTDDEPIYVNAKQYHAILRRRQYRARLEAQNKVIKDRKPYLHESRHLHALKRARGSGGRFLNAKKLQESKQTPMSDGLDVPGSAQPLLTRDMAESEIHLPENHRDRAPTTSCSNVTSASNSDEIFQQPEFRFSGYPSSFGRTMQVHLVDMHDGGGGGGGGGGKHHLR